MAALAEAKYVFCDQLAIYRTQICVIWIYGDRWHNLGTLCSPVGAKIQPCAHCGRSSRLSKVILVAKRWFSDGDGSGA